MQKYHKGDHVRIAADLGGSMSHFPKDCEAIVIGSYADQYGGGGRVDPTYTLYIKGLGRHSWYYESQLTLIAIRQIELLEQWVAEKQKVEDQQSDLDWIFANGKTVLESASGATVGALAKCLGVTNLWGPRGEGFTYYTNSRRVMNIAERYLRTGDKEGWLKLCEDVKAQKEKHGHTSKE